MLLTDKKINHINAITHDGKVLCFGTAADGTIWYTVQRSGFEDTALKNSAEPFGFEGWQALRLGEGIPDASVTAAEQASLTDPQGHVLVRTVYGALPEATNSINAPVQLVSALGYLYVFRQAPTGKLLVSRFVLDGMSNQLVPKLEVRFQRSKQRLTPQQSSGSSVDNLDYRDMDGRPFYEGALELGFVGSVASGWFSALFVPTAESDRYRWHIFACDAGSSKLMLYTVGAASDGLFDVKDYVFGKPDPEDPQRLTYQTIPGIIARTLSLSGQTIAGCPAVTTYDLQKERLTDSGPQLMREAMRIMLAVPVVPVAGASSDTATTAAVSFAIATDGTLSQVDTTPDTSTVLRSDSRELILPLSLLDGIKEYAAATSPPTGTILATEQGDGGKLQIRSAAALPTSFAAGSQVKLRGTQSYDGYYKVLSVDGATFQIAASFTNSEAGFWEAIPAAQAALVFDDMIVGTEKTADGRLKIACPAHDLKVGDAVQISGTRQYDGVFSVAALVPDKNGFVLDAPFFTAEAANLSKVERRGLRMGVGDCVKTPELGLRPPSPNRDLGRTLSTWVRLDSAGLAEAQAAGGGATEGALAVDDRGMMRLSVGADSKLRLTVQMSDGTRQELVDSTALTTDEWAHAAGTVDYSTDAGGQTTLGLCRNGVLVAQAQLGHRTPCQLGDNLMVFDGVDDYVAVPPSQASFAAGITAEAWVYLDPAQASADRTIFCEKRPSNGGDVQFSLKVNDADHRLEAGFYIQSEDRWYTLKLASGLPLRTFVHVAGSYDGQVVRVYVNGALAGTSASFNHALSGNNDGYYIGRRHDVAPPESMWKGHIADVRLWNRVRSDAEIAQGFTTRLSGREAGLVGYWQLDDGTTRDLSRSKLHGTPSGNPARNLASYLHPQISAPATADATIPSGMTFDGQGDYIEVATASAGFTGSFTVAAWAKVLGGPGTVRTLLSTCDASGGVTGLAIYADAANQWTVASGNGTAWATSSAGQAAVGAWVHLACVVTGNTVTAYLNGAPAGTVASAYLASNRSMRIGVGGVAAQGFFNGAIADVQLWSVAHTQADVQANMYRSLSGDEPSLLAYWPLVHDASELSPNRRIGSIKGDPKPEGSGSAHILAKVPGAEIADAQIWDVARSAADIQATMYLELSGHEEGLVAGYRLGAISYEEEPPTVFDYSPSGRSGIVVGTPYAGARRLHRQTGSGSKAVRYGSDELGAVTQRAVYEESFEFKVTSPNAAFDPNQVAFGKLFTFAYWGKANQTSDEIITFPLANVQQDDFVSLGGGWYRATCHVMIPDGVSLMRLFGIGSVRGVWADEATPPASEWTSIDVRRHHIRMVSEAITRESFTDVLALSSLPGQAQLGIDKITDVRRAEANVNRLALQVADLSARLAVAQDNQRYVYEWNQLTSLPNQRAAALAQRDAIANDKRNYYFRVRNSWSGLDMSFGSGYSRPCQTWHTDTNIVLWELRDCGEGYFNIIHKGTGQALARSADNSIWWLVVDPLSDELRMKFMFGAPGLDLNSLTDDRNFVIQTKQYGPNVGIVNQSGVVMQYGDPLWLRGSVDGGACFWWKLLKSDQLLPTPAQTFADLNTTIARLDSQIATSTARLAWLRQVLDANESYDSLNTQLSGVQAALTSARTDLASKNSAFLAALGAAPAASMPILASDERDLSTEGALLDFARPVGRIELLESADGNVLLSYFDAQGRMRLTPYDTAADSRNATFAQWLPDSVRACADLSDSGNKITLAQPVSLSAGSWTCEAWGQFPFAARSDGAACEYSVVAAADGSRNAAMVVRKGSRLGLWVDGWFFDSGCDLSTTLAPGWHHLAISTARGMTSFYADGLKIGSRKTQQPFLRCNGTTDYLQVPAFDSPTTALTVSIWARSATPLWTATGGMCSKRDSFVLHPLVGTTTVLFEVFQGIQGWKIAGFTLPDIQGWHLYTGTFDGGTIRLFVDGELVAMQSAGGTTLQASSGPMYIGFDNFANGLFVNGDIAEVSIWSVARSPVDVRGDFYHGFTGTEAGLLGYWPMVTSGDGGSRKVKDLTAGARNAVVVGNPVDATISTVGKLDIALLGNASTGDCPIGRIAEVRLWNLGLSDAEVAASARVAISGNEPGLIGYWPLSEATASTLVYDRSLGGKAHGTQTGVGWRGCSAAIGNPGTRILNLPERGSAYLSCPGIALSGKSFTIECWARRSGAGFGATFQPIVAMGTMSPNCGLHIGFRGNNLFTLDFWGNNLDAPTPITDTDWHHFAATYDQPSKRRHIYCDGVLVAEGASSADFTGAGPLNIGLFFNGIDCFPGDLAELRIWDRERTATDIRLNMRRRLSGSEDGLLACYALDELGSDNRVKDKKSGAFQGQLNGTARLLLCTTLPAAGANNLLCAEYSSIELAPSGAKQAIMRRCYGYATGGSVNLLPEHRLEELTLAWVGNTQLAPTLLGYIEGAPPVPSENLTIEEGYDEAASVMLKVEAETGFKWTWSSDDGTAFHADEFLGVGWGTEAGIGVESKVSEGTFGGTGLQEFSGNKGDDQSVEATSVWSTTDSLTLAGLYEDRVSCPAVGKRWLPKNVGYALVVSGLGDVFVTKLRGSGRMVSYDVRPVQGQPLDVNTISFMINPAYSLNGSLDGMVGSSPADPQLYAHVPAMRAQYGSNYPASYFRLQEAYDLKQQITRKDKARESFFKNYDSDLGVDGDPATSTAADALSDSEVAKRQADIANSSFTPEDRVRAMSAVSWLTQKMTNLQAKAGKRNAVNTYVWDCNGGLRAEEESFTNAIEHSVNIDSDSTAGIGMETDVLLAGIHFKASILGTATTKTSNTQTLALSKALELSVDLGGVEKRGITDLKDRPFVPGEKVDRYRFMTFYLEGSTQNFSDFFGKVVEPNWLQSNSEEARLLRQTQAGKPSSCWRVLHRVTYVERPTLGAIGQVTAPVVPEFVGFSTLKNQTESVEAALMAKLKEILAKLP